MLLLLVCGMLLGLACSANILTGLLAVGLVFLCVLIHEAGHGVQARALGLPVRRILLLPFGGM
ncbi:MAG: peptidase M50, partial [Anaerolineae bacterium]